MLLVAPKKVAAKKREISDGKTWPPRFALPLFKDLFSFSLRLGEGIDVDGEREHGVFCRVVDDGGGHGFHNGTDFFYGIEVVISEIKSIKTCSVFLDDIEREIGDRDVLWVKI